MQTTAPPRLHQRHVDPAALWERAARLVKSLFAGIISPAHLIRAPQATRREHRALENMIAPIEALVRSLLMSEAVAWLLGTEAGAETLRDARRNAQRKSARDAEPAPPKPTHARAQSATRTSASEPPPPCDAPAPDAPAEEAVPEITEAEIAAFLARKKLAFQPYENAHSGHIVTGRKRAPSDPALHRRKRRRITRNMKLARRAEVLRQIIEDRSRMVEAIARDLAARELASLYVPSPRNWIDARWSCGHSEIREARRASFTRFRYLHQTRQRDDMLALPPPEPG